MAVAFRRYSLFLPLLLLVLSAAAGPTFAAVAPDVIFHSSISSSLTTPVRLAADSAGYMYVSDPRSGAVVKFASDGSHAATIPAAAGILGVAVTSSGDILVSQKTSIAVYSNTGTKLREFGAFGRANGITVAKTGEIFVVDSAGNNVQVFSADFTPRNLGATNSFGSIGSATGQFRQPTGIAYEKISDQIAVADTRNGRIQFFSTTGVFQKSIGSFGSGPLKFTSPQSVTFEYSADQLTLKRIYVVDAFQSTVQVIDGLTSEFVRYIGNYGIVNGKLVTPSDILFDGNRRLVVANGTGKLSLFGVADPSTGPFLQIDAIPQATNLATLAVSGTTTGTSVSINGAPALLNGSLWSGIVALTPGVNLITVVASDARGSTSRTASITAIAPALNPVSLTLSPVAPQTAQAALALFGTVTQGAGVTVNGTAAVVNGTNWSASITLTAGVNTLRISAAKSGMSTSSIDVSVTLDTGRPVMAARLPSPGSVFSRPLQTISGTVSSASAANVIVTLNGTARSTPVSDGVFSIPVILAPGNNSISVSAVDSSGAATAALSSSVTYDPQAPRLVINTPVAAVSGIAAYRLEGSAPSGSSVTVNGNAANPNGTAWSADVQLAPGLNSFEVRASLPSGTTTTAMTSLAYSPGLPALSITTPPKDSPVATSSFTLTGTSTPGTVLTARINGAPAQLNSSASGAFSVAVPAMSANIGTYTVTVTALDAAGAISTTTRSIVYEAAPPVITAVSASPLIVTAPGGVLAARDKNGPVGSVTVANGIASLDLTGVTYDPATLNIQAFSPAGLSSRNGDINLDGKVGIADALLALRSVVGLEAPLSLQQMLHGDVGPIANGEPTVDGLMGMADVLAILEKIIGRSAW